MKGEIAKELIQSAEAALYYANKKKLPKSTREYFKGMYCVYLNVMYKLKIKHDLEPIE